MDDLTAFEQAVLDKILAGDDAGLAALRAQANAARLRSREYTGTGFFLEFEVPEGLPAPAVGSLQFGDVHATVDGLQHGAGFLVFVRDGKLDALEGYSYDEPWPSEIRSFALRYEHEPRRLTIPIP